MRDIVKSRKELAAMGIRSAKLSDDKIDLSQFIKVDIRTLSALNISTSRISILTPMPTNSYSIVKNSDGTSTLQINSPADFWQYSNILIIQTR